MLLSRLFTESSFLLRSSNFLQNNSLNVFQNVLVCNFCNRRRIERIGKRE